MKLDKEERILIYLTIFSILFVILCVIKILLGSL